MKIRTLFNYVLAVFVLSLSIVALVHAESGSSHDGRKNVCLIDLIANPKMYDGKSVHLKGFARIKFEGNALYMSRDDVNYGNTANAIWLGIDTKDPTSSKYDGKWIRVEGTFNSKHTGHGGLFSGAIDNIKRIELLEKYNNY